MTATSPDSRVMDLLKPRLLRLGIRSRESPVQRSYKHNAGCHKSEINYSSGGYKHDLTYIVIMSG